MSDAWFFENIFVFLLAAGYALTLLKAVTIRVSRQTAECREVHHSRRRTTYEDRLG